MDACWWGGRCYSYIRSDPSLAVSWLTHTTRSWDLTTRAMTAIVSDQDIFQQFTNAKSRKQYQRTWSQFVDFCLYTNHLELESDAASPHVYLFPPLQWDTLRFEYSVSNDKPLSYSVAYDAFKGMLSKAGLNPSLYGLHSPRSGGATEAFVLKIDPHIIDLKGRWKSPFTKYNYVRLSDAMIVERSKKSIPY